MKADETEGASGRLVQLLLGRDEGVFAQATRLVAPGPDGVEPDDEQLLGSMDGQRFPTAP